MEKLEKLKNGIKENWIERKQQKKENRKKE